MAKGQVRHLAWEHAGALRHLLRDTCSEGLPRSRLLGDGEDVLEGGGIPGVPHPVLPELRLTRAPVGGDKGREASLERAGLLLRELRAALALVERHEITNGGGEVGSVEVGGRLRPGEVQQALGILRCGAEVRLQERRGEHPNHRARLELLRLVGEQEQEGRDLFAIELR